MRYVHKFDGTEHEAPEGSLNWPWIPADEPDKYADTRARARAHVTATVDEARKTAAEKRGPGRPRKGSPDA